MGASGQARAKDGPAISAELIARAVIAAAVRLELDPALVMGGQGRLNDKVCVTAAISALQRVTGAAMTRCCAPLKVRDTTVHHARKARRPDFLKAEASALAALGYAAWRPEARAGASPPSPAIPEIVHGPPPSPAEPARAADAADGALIVQPVAAPATPAARAAPRPPRERPRLAPAPEPRSRPGAPAPRLERPQPAPAAPPPAAAPRPLRRPSERTIGYARRFLAARWALDEVAHLFDADPEALGAALEGRRA